MTEIKVQVSNIATLIGRNKYKSVSDGVEILLLANKHLKKTNTPTETEVKNKIVREFSKIKNVGNNSNKGLEEVVGKYIDKDITKSNERIKVKKTELREKLAKSSNETLKNIYSDNSLKKIIDDVKPVIEEVVINKIINEVIEEDVERISIDNVINKVIEEDINIISEKTKNEVVADGTEVSESEIRKNIEEIFAEESILSVNKSAREDVVGIVNRTKGVVGEKNSIARLEKIVGNKINPCLRTSKLEIISPTKGIKIVILGRIDGYDNKKTYEIKNRQNKLFGLVPEYEMVQCVYYAVMENRPCCLVQDYKGEIDIMTTFEVEMAKKMLIYFNQELCRVIEENF